MILLETGVFEAGAAKNLMAFGGEELLLTEKLAANLVRTWFVFQKIPSDRYSMASMDYAAYPRTDDGC